MKRSTDPGAATAARNGPVHAATERIQAVFRRRRAAYALLVLCAVGLVALALLAAFADPLLLRVDRPVQGWVIGLRERWLNEALAWVSRLGTRYVIGALGVVLATWTLITGRCRVVLFVVVVAFALNPLVEWALKAAVDRPRPELLTLVRGRGPSFPSGHVIASVGFYGVLPALVAGITSRFAIRAAAFLAVTIIILGVGFSRIYLGVHWFTDVLGGFLLGTVVVLGTYQALGGHRLDRSRTCCPRGPEVGHRSRSPSLPVVSGGD